MTVYKFLPGWAVTSRLMPEDTYNGARLLVVNIHYDVLDADALDREIQILARHTFEYLQDSTGLWTYRGQDAWNDTVCPVKLASMEMAVYDAMVRFQVHEVKHFLRREDDTPLVDPHPEQ
jgi:hypothetical protein